MVKLLIQNTQSAGNVLTNY